MPETVSLLPRLFAMPVLLLFLALPVISAADQVEDIPETDQQVRPAGDGAAKDAGNGTTATSAGQMPAATAPATTPPAAQALTAPAEKSGAEKPNAGKSGQDRPTAADGPDSARKDAGTGSSSMWQGFLSIVGLHDDRQTIPPMEVKNAPQHPGQDYVIGPGDLLGISVWRDDSLTRSVVVLPDGKIHFPLIGEIPAGGKSVAQLKQAFIEKLSSYVVDADISVEVKQSNSLFIYIIGRVNSPGRQMLIADTTVLQALAMAGGLTPFAEKDEIKVFRKDGDRTLVYSFRYSQVVSGNILDDNLLLKRGDVIVVP